MMDVKASQGASSTGGIDILIVVLFASVLAVGLADLSCLDREGKPVAWFSLIKFPGNVTTTHTRYAYIDANSGSRYQVISGSHVDDPTEALPKTIQAINVVNPLTINKLVYNDQPPNIPYNPDGGHAKGIIAFNNQTESGVYIMHSFPKYPNVTEVGGFINYKTPSNTYVYAQNAYCITIDREILGHLIDNLPIAEPNVYYASGLFKGRNYNSTIGKFISQFHLKNGDEQWYLSKNSAFPGFLYEDIIAPYFKTDLAVQSWGRPYQGPRCPPKAPYTVVNIDQLSFDSETTWDHYSDHSKWALTTGNSGKKLACLCDMNRMDTQLVRGGSCLCSSNQNLYQALSKIVVLKDVCPTSRKFKVRA